MFIDVNRDSNMQDKLNDYYAIKMIIALHYYSYQKKIYIAGITYAGYKGRI